MNTASHLDSEHARRIPNETPEKVEALRRLQAEIAAKFNALLPSILDKAFRGEL